MAEASEAPETNKKNGLSQDITLTEESDKQSTKNATEDANKPPEQVGVLELFRFADGLDRFLIVCGIFAAIAHGTAMPILVILFGDMIDTFLGNSQFTSWWTDNSATILASFNVSQSQLMNDPAALLQVCTGLNMTAECSSMFGDATNNFLGKINSLVGYFCIIGVATMVLGYCQLVCWDLASFRQCQRIRLKLFHNVIRQEIGWFDTHEAGELNTRLSDDVTKIQVGIGEKMGLFFQSITSFLAGFVVGFVYGWKMTLVILAISPLLALAAALTAKVMATFTSKELLAYARAGAVAEEVLVAIRTVVSFSGQRKECDRYNKNLSDAKDFGIRKGVANGLAVGLVYIIMFSAYALAFWYGGKLVREGEYTGGRLLIVFFSVLIGAMSIGNAAPSLANFGTARGAAYMLYNLIDLEPKIDSSSESGEKLDSIKGNVEFRDVYFNYPSRPDVKILQGLNLKAHVGQTVALVGSSGCGKSTTVQLLQRFYDPVQGQVLIDGVDVKQLNVRWLRQNIGVVSQEPVLFATTIEQNIRYGREQVTQEEIEHAARRANAHDFISKLPQRYETMVGERGAQLSGGQKQRIAIARALVRDPKILLLDEATSALDTSSEAIVQAALDKAREGRTTLVIAHRLSTIQTADVIVGFQEGAVAEQGSHAQLMEHGGIYHSLVMNQTRKSSTDEDQEKDSDVDFVPDMDVQLAKKQATMSLTRRRSSIKLKPANGDIDAEKAEDGDNDDTTERGEDDDKPEEASVTRIARLNATEWPYIAIGCLAALVTGSVQPVFSFIFASVIGALVETDKAKQEQSVNLYSCIFLAVGAAAALGMFLQGAMLAVAGEKLTMRLRQMTFKSILRQEVAWFDLPENGTGVLTTRLAMDASAVQGATGSQLATLLQSLCSVVIGLTIGFVYSWKLTLVVLCFAPLLFFSGFVRMKMMSDSAQKDKKAFEGAGKVAIESIENIRTVATLTKEQAFYEKYTELTNVPHKQRTKTVFVDGLAFGFSQGIIFFAYAACFAYGGYLIKHEGLSFDSMFKVFSAIIFSAMAVGQTSSFAPDYSKAKIAAARIFNIIDREPIIDSYSEEGQKPKDVTGTVSFENIRFRYPARPDVPVLEDLTVEIGQSQTLALVGPSGCGKSTSVLLLERFYNPLAGIIKLDSVDVADLNIEWLRSQIGIVSQEPILFDCSIAENIAYGDNSREIRMDEIIAAAKDANIHNFIQALPGGYETNVGDKGAQLSGGQKQRIAIARALVRNPKILLLDEATSALDTESEKIVQEALDSAREGRTCIVIAHRLSTIHGAERIAVINNGMVTEMGNHSELMAKQGLYHKLNTLQASQT